MDKPADYPDIVYKYRNWKDDFHKNVLRRNHLFLTSPKDFNDPFDCRIPTNYSLLDTPDKIRAYVDKTTVKHFDFLVQGERDIEKEMKKIEYRISNELDKLQKEHEDILFDSQDKHYGVLSLSSRWDSILMWSHYADYHRGYCAGLLEEKLRNFGAFGSGGPVVYP